MAEQERRYPDAETLAGQITDRIVDRLSGSLISSALPAEVGDWIRDTCQHGSMWWSHTIPMKGPTCIGMHWKFHPDGTAYLEMANTNGEIFWRGAFHPAERGPDA